MLLVGGEAGIGKSALVQRFCADAVERRVPRAAGRLRPHPDAAPAGAARRHGGGSRCAAHEAARRRGRPGARVRSGDRRLPGATHRGRVRGRPLGRRRHARPPALPRPEDRRHACAPARDLPPRRDRPPPPAAVRPGRPRHGAGRFPDGPSAPDPGGGGAARAGGRRRRRRTPPPHGGQPVLRHRVDRRRRPAAPGERQRRRRRPPLAPPRRRARGRRVRQRRRPLRRAVAADRPRREPDAIDAALAGGLLHEVDGLLAFRHELAARRWSGRSRPRAAAPCMPPCSPRWRPCPRRAPTSPRSRTTPPRPGTPTRSCAWRPPRAVARRASAPTARRGLSSRAPCPTWSGSRTRSTPSCSRRTRGSAPSSTGTPSADPSG
jgi:hypothetical protein